eukprot:GHUV01044171.1.p1 GENE.GHUV01044171.1~~GHUV01044171.1.p1  ORF type:complete len:145 (-),score=24.13 GHUV01044171.1:448-882(-)
MDLWLGILYNPNYLIQSIDNGARLRVKGEGNAGRRGAPPGDLIVYIRVKEHPELRREGIDIHSDIEISYVDAILGSQVKVTTVDGPVELKIPAGTQPGTTLLMAKRGVPRLGASNQVRGNHNVSMFGGGSEGVDRGYGSWVAAV